MKATFKILAIGLLFITISCKNNQKENSTTTKTTTEQTQSKEKGKEYTSAYVCPMHCKGSGSDKEGKCPTCNMDYVKNKDYKKKM
ncbi:heavy metal-binding domain-containing protein [Tenacibaculum aiptasiae]|uniref:heavy metal-binding domain-containing protein n=1 Tax=Tenacibaculum aiptasiae TaxID=426481 RepID=UPI00232BBB9B|nr:heavy metal-binding domain-containing protein [Tenacibaculum aiptasiae]